MKDRVVGIFEDRASAEKAMSDLVAAGVSWERVTVKRVLQPGHRGFANSETVHSLIHAPELHEGDNVSDDAGTVILIVEIMERAEEPDEQQEAEVDPHDTAAMRQTLDELGATETHVIPATPGLDL